MPIQTRCPACAAAVPTNATWCSLCHTDLRARREPSRTSAGTTPAYATSVLPAPETASAAAAPTLTAVADVASPTDVPEDEPRGRHSRGAQPAAPAEPTGGRHAGRRSAGRTTTTYADYPDLAGIPTDLEADPERVEEVADAMLSRLSLTEPRSRLLDPDELPGGRWGLAAGGLVAISALLLVVYSVLGAVLSH